MFKQKTKKQKQKGFSQTMLIIGIVLILAVGSIILLDVHRDRVMEEKIEELRQQVRPQQPGLLEQEPLVVPPLEPTPEEIAQWEQEIKWMEEFQPRMIMSLEGTGSMRTETFTIEDPRLTADIRFFSILDDFPLPNKPAFDKITLYRVGEPEPVIPGYGSTTSKELLKEHGWKPGVGFPVRDLEGDEPLGTIGGLTSIGISIGTGEFYFVIDVQNVDRWVLTVEEVIAH